MSEEVMYTRQYIACTKEADVRKAYDTFSAVDNYEEGAEKGVEQYVWMFHTELAEAQRQDKIKEVTPRKKVFLYLETVKDRDEGMVYLCMTTMQIDTKAYKARFPKAMFSKYNQWK